MTLIGHLSELRRRIMWAAISVVLATLGAFFFTDNVITLLKAPLKETPNAHIIFTTPGEGFGAYLQVALSLGIVVSLPFVLLQAVLFVAPGLTRKEKTYLYALLPASLISFAIGATFAYLVLIPPAIQFLVNFGSQIAEPFININAYIGTITRLLLYVGLIFELPLVIFFLAKVGVVNARWLSRKRKYVVVLIFVVAAIVTPTPDPINQLLVALPMIVLFEVGVLLARIA